MRSEVIGIDTVLFVILFVVYSFLFSFSIPSFELEMWSLPVQCPHVHSDVHCCSVWLLIAPAYYSGRLLQYRAVCSYWEKVQEDRGALRLSDDSLPNSLCTQYQSPSFFHLLPSPPPPLFTSQPHLSYSSLFQSTLLPSPLILHFLYRLTCLSLTVCHCICC